ncbi:MAG: hypothetical protein HY904_08780 [Deltaproteobacteria bacterium]|nr:hypothetical protein [Deltaproteobacteria bacterium]
MSGLLLLLLVTGGVQDSDVFTPPAAADDADEFDEDEDGPESDESDEDDRPRRRKRPRPLRSEPAEEWVVLLGSALAAPVLYGVAVVILSMVAGSALYCPPLTALLAAAVLGGGGWVLSQAMFKRRVPIAKVGLGALAGVLLAQAPFLLLQLLVAAVVVVVDLALIALGAAAVVETAAQDPNGAFWTGCYAAFCLAYLGFWPCWAGLVVGNFLGILAQGAGCLGATLGLPLANALLGRDMVEGDPTWEPDIWDVPEPEADLEDPPPRKRPRPG